MRMQCILYMYLMAFERMDVQMNNMEYLFALCTGGRARLQHFRFCST